MKAKVKQNQSVLDLAIEHGGDITSSFELAKQNNLQVDAVIAPGTELDIHEVINPSVSKQFKKIDPPATLYFN